MGGNEPIKYVTFGGVQVPESSTRKVINRNGQQIYCVWTDNNGKITYPEQHTYVSNVAEYKRTDYYPSGFASLYDFNPRTYHISKREFEDLYWNTAFNRTGSTNIDGFTYTYGNTTGVTIGGRRVDTGSFSCERLDTTPKIDISADTGLIFDTQYVTLSNMRGATVTGSTDEDNITLMNSSNCTVDVSNANNNMFVSDNVTVVNGQGNKVKAGDHDQVTFGTHDYETNVDRTKAEHKGEGTYRQ